VVELQERGQPGKEYCHSRHQAVPGLRRRCLTGDPAGKNAGESGLLLDVILDMIGNSGRNVSMGFAKNGFRQACNPPVHGEINPSGNYWQIGKLRSKLKPQDHHEVDLNELILYRN